MIDDSFSLPGGESMQGIGKRVGEAIQKITSEFSTEFPLIIGHQGSLSFGLSYLIEKSSRNWENYQVLNCSVTILNLSRKPKIEIFNHNSHLGTNSSDLWSL